MPAPAFELSNLTITSDTPLSFAVVQVRCAAASKPAPFSFDADIRSALAAAARSIAPVLSLPLPSFNPGCFGVANWVTEIGPGPCLPSPLDEQPLNTSAAVSTHKIPRMRGRLGGRDRRRTPRRSDQVDA